MDKIFGSSVVTSLLGYLAGALVIINEMVTAGGWPETRDGWMKFGFGVLVALLGRNSKDENVSNAPAPATSGAVVKPV